MNIYIYIYILLLIALFFSGDEIVVLSQNGGCYKARPEYVLKKAINIDPTVGSLSYCYMSFQRLISLELLLFRYSVTGRSCRAILEYFLKSHKY
jgi:hypothetical protein